MEEYDLPSLAEQGRNLATSAQQAMQGFLQGDDVFVDDDMFDGWMIYQKRQREKERKQHDLDRIAGKNAGDAGEVFIVAESEEDVDRIQSLNDTGTRRQLQQKFNYIKSSDSPVKEKD